MEKFSESPRQLSGSEAEVQWLLDGRWIGETQGSRSLLRDFDAAGVHELTALADNGAWHSLRFRLLAADRDHP